MKMRKCTILLLLSSLTLCIGSGLALAADKEPIKIGCVVSLTGFMSLDGNTMVEGMELALEDLNSKGGLLGRKVTGLYRDDETQPTIAIRRYNDLVKTQGIVMHSGIVHGGVASAIVQANKNLGDSAVICFQTVQTPSQKTPQNMDPFLFFSGISQESMGSSAGEYAVKNLGKKGFLIYPDYVLGWSQRDALKPMVEQNGGELLGMIAVPQTTNDFQPYLTQILAKQPDWVVNIFPGMMNVNFVRQAYAMGLKNKMKIVSTLVNIEEVHAIGPDAIKDVFIVCDYFWNLPGEKNKAFVERFMKKFGNDRRPSMRHFEQYVAVTMWANAVNKVGTLDPKTVRSAMLGMKYDFGKGESFTRTTGDHTFVTPIVIARGKGPNEMKDKFDTQEIVQINTGEKYYYSPKDLGW
jgi:ABC-type branched-subunit amino acid transport system substrate-binding protein